jgi:hypothetical protein
MRYLYYHLLINLCCMLSFAQVPGNIIVCPDSEKIAISPLVFGSGDEMSACFSPLAETEPLIIATRPTLLRFGGIAAEYLDWEADSLGGVFYIDFVDTLLIPDAVEFGVDSFLRLCEVVNAQPILTVNMQLADTALARRMVEYVNGDTTTPMGQLRAQRGHPLPYDVSIWSLGNEPDIAGGQWPAPPWGYWTFYRHFGIPFANWSWQDSVFWTPQDFANIIPAYVTAMQGASPIELEFIYSIAGAPSWIRPVIEPNLNLIDYLDIHYYASSAWDSIADTTDYIEWLSRTDTIYPVEEVIRVYRDSLDAIGASSIKLVVLEYNSGIIIVPDPLWWNYLTGIFVADCIGHFMHAGLEMAAVYSIHEGEPGSSDFPYLGIVRGDTASRRLPSHVLELYSTYFGDSLVYSFSDHKNSGYGIECWASKRASDGVYVYMVINKTLDTTYTMTMQLEDSVQFYHLYTITNNAPISAPYNGSTGIEDQGLSVPDSIRAGWSYLTCDFEPISISLFEVEPYFSIEESSFQSRTKLQLPTVFSGPLNLPEDINYRLFDIAGREVAADNMAPGIYFIEIDGLKTVKVIKLK